MHAGWVGAVTGSPVLMSTSRDPDSPFTQDFAENLPSKAKPALPTADTPYCGAVIPASLYVHSPGAVLAVVISLPSKIVAFAGSSRCSAPT